MKMLKEFIVSEMRPLTIALSSLFQRWKEQYFVNVGTDCGLTIAGFYYVCFSCNDGSISGFYYDPNSRCYPLPFPVGFLWSQLFTLNFSMLISYLYYTHVLIKSFCIFLSWILLVWSEWCIIKGTLQTYNRWLEKSVADFDKIHAHI